MLRRGYHVPIPTHDLARDFSSKHPTNAMTDNTLRELLRQYQAQQNSSRSTDGEMTQRMMAEEGPRWTQAMSNISNLMNLTGLSTPRETNIMANGLYIGSEAAVEKLARALRDLTRLNTTEYILTLEVDVTHEMLARDIAVITEWIDAYIPGPRTNLPAIPPWRNVRPAEDRDGQYHSFPSRSPLLESHIRNYGAKLLQAEKISRNDLINMLKGTWALIDPTLPVLEEIIARTVATVRIRRRMHDELARPNVLAEWQIMLDLELMTRSRYAEYVQKRTLYLNQSKLPAKLALRESQLTELHLYYATYVAFSATQVSAASAATP